MGRLVGEEGIPIDFPDCAPNWTNCEVCGALGDERCRLPADLTCSSPDGEVRKEMASYEEYFARRENPGYYSRFDIEPIDFIEKNGLGFSVGNVIKYVTRYDDKGGLEDLRKAKRYIEFLIASEEGRDPSEAAE